MEKGESERAMQFLNGVYGTVRQTCVYVYNNAHLCPLIFATPANDLGAAGAAALRPALEKLTNLKCLYLAGACGDGQRLGSEIDWVVCW